MKRLACVRLVVTDLDNTLYDWVSYFVPAFYEMVTVAAPLLEVSLESLLDDLQRIHRKHGNSEHPFALLETDAVGKRFPGLSREAQAQQLNEAFIAFNRRRKQTLKLYPNVFETLKFITDQGTDLVAYTEAPSINALHRIRFLGLTSLFSGIYAPESIGVNHPSIQHAHSLEQEHQLLHALHSNHRKPSPKVLQEICEYVNVSPSETLYIGDSLTRDMGMANAAGILGAWARYGTVHDPELWEKLVRVTHWTSSDVEREETLKQRFGGTKPDIELGDIAELTSHVEFAPALQAINLITPS